MKKQLAAIIAATALVIAPVSAANAFTTTVNGHEWEITDSYFGVEELDTYDEDVFDYSYLSLSIDGGSNYSEYECRNSDWMSETVIGSGKAVTCDELVTVVEGLNVRGYAYIYPDGLLTAVTYKITNTLGESVSFKWKQSHNYGNGQISDSDFGDVYSLNDGTVNPSKPAAIAWGPTTEVCSAASGVDDGNDGMDVESESCSIAPGASTAITIYHMADNIGNLANLQSNANTFFVTRGAEATMAQGIPTGLTAANWDIAGSMNTADIPAVADPYDATQTMTLTGAAQMGEPMTISFNNGETPVGDYYDIWMCPNTDVKPVDGAETGECVAVTFWNRALVANYNQQTSALTMTWSLADIPVPGRVSVGGDNYLDDGGDPILIDPPTDGEGGWCQYEGWYLIVNDYDGGAHSNFSDALSATGCSDSPSGNGGLAETGVDAQPTGLVGLFALIGGLAVTVAMRRRAARSL